MLDNWLYIGLFIIVALFIPAVAVLIPRLIGPKKPNALKREIY